MVSFKITLFKKKASFHLTKIVIYTRETPPCAYCKTAKTLLQYNNLPYTEIVIGVDITREEVMSTYPSIKTLPIVVIDDVLIGGSDKLSQWIKNNVG